MTEPDVARLRELSAHYQACRVLTHGEIHELAESALDRIAVLEAAETELGAIKDSGGCLCEIKYADPEQSIGVHDQSCPCGREQLLVLKLQQALDRIAVLEAKNLTTSAAGVTVMQQYEILKKEVRIMLTHPGSIGQRLKVAEVLGDE